MRTRPTWAVIALGIGALCYVAINVIAFGSATIWLAPFTLLCATILFVATNHPDIKELAGAAQIDYIKKRPLLWQFGAVLLGLGQVGVVISAWQFAQKRELAQEVVSIADVCERADTWERLSPEIRDVLNTGEAFPATQSRGLCEQRERTTAHQAFLAKCNDVIAHMEAGSISNNDLDIVRTNPPIPSHGYLLVAEDAAQLATRISKGLLNANELRIPTEFPCGPNARHAFLMAAGRSVNAWGTIVAEDKVDESLLTALGARALDAKSMPAKSEAVMTAAAKEALQKNAESVAASVSNPKTADDCTSALQICVLSMRFGTVPGPACNRLTNITQKLSQQAKAAEAKQEAIRAAKEARCEAERERWQACDRQCDNLLFAYDDDAVFRCGERCSTAHPLPSCTN